MSISPLQSAPLFGPGGAVVFSDRALYETYNFHDPGALERFAGWLARDPDGDEPGVAVVTGRPGSGRDYFVRAAAWLAGERGVPMRHVRLSFDGFDPDGKASMEDFARHQLRLRFAPEEGAAAPAFDKRAALVGLASSLPATFLGAAGIGFLVAGALSVVDVRALLESDLPALAGPRASGAEQLRAILDFAMRGQRLVLVVPADELPETTVQWFLHEPRRDRRLSVVLTRARVPDEPVLYGEPLGQVQELGQMTPETLRERVDLRFGPHEFPDAFFSGLWKRTQGVPGQVALAMMDLDRRELITRGDGPGKPWRLAVEPDDARLVDYFASHFYDHLNQIRNQHGPIDLHLVRFVELAALCGSIAPPRLIASYMGLTESERDDLLDRVDELEDAGRPVFTSLDYQHPAFRNEGGGRELVYRFADESNRLIVLRRMVQKGREAKGLLDYLAARVPVFTRSNAEMLATLAGYLPEGSAEREEYTRRLRWWADSAEAGAFVAFLAGEMRAGRVTAEVLWRVAQDRVEWPAVRRLALLQAMETDPDGIALGLLPYYHHLHSMLLARLGYLGESLASSLAGLRLTPAGEAQLRKALHVNAYHASKNLMLTEQALGHAREAYVLAQAVSSPRTADSVSAASRLAAALVTAGRGSEAPPFVEAALALADDIEELEEIEIGRMMNELGIALHGVGDLERAIRCHRRSLESDERLDAASGYVTSDHAMSHSNLGGCLRAHGELDEAREHLEKAVEIALQCAGPGHGAYSVSLLELMSIDLISGDHEALTVRAALAREFLEIGPPDMIVKLKRLARALFPGETQTDEALPAHVRETFELLLRPDPDSADDAVDGEAG